MLNIPITLDDCTNCSSKSGQHSNDANCVLRNLEKIKSAVKGKLKEMGRHGSFEIETVRNKGGYVYNMEKTGKWEKTVESSSRHIFS